MTDPERCDTIFTVRDVWQWRTQGRGVWNLDPSCFFLTYHNIPTYDGITINEILTFVCDTDPPRFHSEIISTPLMCSSIQL